MEISLADEIIGDLRRVRLAVADQRATVSFLSGVQRLRGFLDALEVEAARRLHELSHAAPAELAKATQRHARAGDRVYERAAPLMAVPSLVAPLEAGVLQAGHVDTVAKVMRTVDEKHAGAFASVLPDLIADAAASKATPDDLARILNRAARALQNDDGMTRFDQQRRDAALHCWTDKRTGIFRLSGGFDPLSGVMLHGHLQAMLSALFAERVPSTCPTDPGAKQDHPRPCSSRPHHETAALRACRGAGPARSTLRHVVRRRRQCSRRRRLRRQRRPRRMVGLLSGRTEQVQPPEIVVVVDARQEALDANRSVAVVDWGLPVELPPRALENLFQRADAHPVIVVNGVVLHAPGEMNFGRTTRLASTSQRRALRALYPTCAVPGCCVAYEFTKPHHVHCWEHGGPTDLHNLLPLCSRHHRAAHEGGRELTLQRNRTLTITLPDGSILTTGPPVRLRAA